MKRIKRAEAMGYALDARLPPTLHVAAGETFVVEAEDASSGLMAERDLLPTVENLPYLKHHPAKANPVAGPIFVEGLERGRVLVEILNIDVAEQGATWSRPGASPFRDSRRWGALAEPQMSRVRHVDGEAVLSPRLRWPVTPMVGTLACAPEWEVHSTSTGQGPWGGNLDVSEYLAGCKVFLNGFHAGGLLFVGDVHGCQGDGEYTGIADETRAEVTLRVAQAEGPPMPFPRIESSDRITALYVARPLELAAHGAVQHLMTWLVEDFGFDDREAYLAVGLHPDFRLRVHQMTAIEELRYVVGASLPKSLLV